MLFKNIDDNVLGEWRGVLNNLRTEMVGCCLYDQIPM